MERLTNFGPRPVGSYECDVQAAAYIRQALDTIKLGAGAGVSVEVDTQTASGGFHLPGFEVYQRYQGVTNVVVRLSNASRPAPAPAILVNCHFDSVPQGPGARCGVTIQFRRSGKYYFLLDY